MPVTPPAPPGPERPAQTSLGRRRWVWRLAAAFVVLTLLALVAVSWFVQSRVDQLRARVTNAEPARTLALQWQLALVRELLAATELLMGDSSAIGRYRMERERERMAQQALRPLAAELRLSQALERARHAADEWHVYGDTIRLQQLERRTLLLEFPRERELFQDALAAVSEFDNSITNATAEVRDLVERTEQAGLRATLVLAVLALVAAATVFALEARVRRFALEAEHRREETVAALAELARQADARNRLMRGITHDVKNPLGAAKGYAELLAMGVKGELNPEQQTLVAGVERSVDGALAIIGDLLDLAGLETGRITLNCAEADLVELTRHAVEDNRALAATTGHNLEQAAPDAPLQVETDAAKVRQVLDNLLSNAIKYTPSPGHIMVRVSASERRGAPRPGDWAAISVSDSGPGIPPDQRESIFDEFTRLAQDSPQKGHGLGLAISRRLAHRLGGDLTLADSGPGATFILWVPRRPAPA